jgi:hypothetical protein
VIVSANGTLIAYGNGNAPDWITDAAGAESWAFYISVSMCMSCPHVITDCMNILTMLELGPELATSANRALARVWNLIFPAIDGEPYETLANQKVVWMPSHRTTASIGCIMKSNGKFITALDWRANRLVDKLAKLGAQQHCVPDLAIDTFNAASAAAEYCAALVGTVTFKANHHSIEVTRKNGSQGMSIVRDSLPGKRPPKPQKRKEVPEADSNAQPMHATTSVSASVHQSRPMHSEEPRVRSVQALQAAQFKKARLQAEAIQEQSFQAARRESRDKRPPPAPPLMTAKDRMEALRRRVFKSS